MNNLMLPHAMIICWTFCICVSKQLCCLLSIWTSLFQSCKKNNNFIIDCTSVYKPTMQGHSDLLTGNFSLLGQCRCERQVFWRQHAPPHCMLPWPDWNGRPADDGRSLHRHWEWGDSPRGRPTAGRRGGRGCGGGITQVSERPSAQRLCVWKRQTAGRLPALSFQKGIPLFGMQKRVVILFICFYENLVVNSMDCMQYKMLVCVKYGSSAFFVCTCFLCCVFQSNSVVVLHVITCMMWMMQVCLIILSAIFFSH